jgi:hypothetical protein
MLAAIAKASGGRVLWPASEPREAAVVLALPAAEPQRSSA